MNNYDPDYLDSFIHEYTFKKIKEQNPVTGTLYNISLPWNFSGIDVSFVRLRTGRFRKNGANYGFFRIPPKIHTLPYVKRLDIIYQNLGNWSSYYYNVPNHTFVAPVIGFLAYDSDSSIDKGKLLLSIARDPIEVHFPSIDLPEDFQNLELKCVRFGHDGVVGFSNVSKASTCVVRDQGHFSIVVPSKSGKTNRKGWEWWMVGVVAGASALFLLVFCPVVAYKSYRLNRIRKMEKQSERSEALDSIYIGSSRMPSAQGIRTQPVLENSYVP
ncbi:hypothetical protein Leryth_004109 [Lithospermum erythrorhizon]|nr:hypothetical protein Leryth_004109 [Lithospermum erythrorhizon]